MRQSTFHNSRREWSLIAISANHGDLALLQFIVNKIKLKNVKRTARINAINLAAYKGHLEIYEFLSGRLGDKNPGNTSMLNRLGRTPLHRLDTLQNSEWKTTRKQKEEVRTNFY